MPTIKIPVHAIVTEPSFTEQGVKGMLAGAKSVYSSLDVIFELVSFEQDSDPALKKDEATGGPPLNFELAREARAVRYPGCLVILFRQGNGSYSSAWADYVVMGGTNELDFAHEVGHFLHLGHTHTGEIVLGKTKINVIQELYNTNRDKGYEEAKKLAIDLIRRAGGVGVFDGDLTAVQDTPPDPGPPLFQPSGYNPDGSEKNPNEHCSGSGTLTLVVDGKGYALSPDRKNIMSYFKRCPGAHNISPHQGQIIQRALLSGNRRHLMSGAVPESPAAIVSPDGAIHVFARGDDRNIWHNFWDRKKWSGWRADLASGTLSSGPAVIVSPDGAIHVFARGDDRNIWHSVWDGKTWSEWQSDLGAGKLSSGPAAIVSPDGAIHVFARGDDRNIWHSVWDGKTWSEWQSDLGAGKLSSGPAAIVSPDGAIHVFARGDDRNIWHSFWDRKKWSGWRADLASGTLSSGPAVIVSPDGAIHVFARGDDRNIWHSFWDGKAWSEWQPNLANGTFMSGLTAVVTADKALHAFTQGDDRNIWHSFWNGSVWSEWLADLGAGTFQP